MIRARLIGYGIAAALIGGGGIALYELDRSAFMVALVALALLAVVSRLVIRHVGSVVAAAGYLILAVLLIGGGLALWQNQRPIVYTSAAVVAAVYWTCRRMRLSSGVAGRVGLLSAIAIVLFGLTHGGVPSWEAVIPEIATLLLGAIALWFLFVASWFRAPRDHGSLPPTDGEA